MSDYDPTASEDAEIAALLRQAGSRIKPPDEVMREVHAAVHAEWRDVVAERERLRRRRTYMTWAAAAAVGALAVGLGITTQMSDVQARPMATLQRTSGDVFVAADGAHWQPLQNGQPVAVGDFVRSDAPAALRVANGIALRMNSDTAFHVEALDRLALTTGAVYVDSQPGEPGSDLRIVTSAGVVRHVGTQYLVRARAGGIDVSVREGRVLVENAADENAAGAGERLRISNHGAVQRDTVSATDPQWRWASDIAPPFAIENQPLAAFLDWVARETGRTLDYETPQAKSTAEGVTLHGSIEDLTPDTALAAVLATTSLRLKHTDADSIAVTLGE